MTATADSLLGIGLVGVGRHGSRYLRHLLYDLPGVRLAAICRRQIAEPPPGSDVRMYNDYRAMMTDPFVKAVVVVTHPTFCRDICLEAVEQRKPILIEKPLATTGMDARAMVAAASRTGILLMTAQTMRFDPIILRLKEELPNIGPLKSASLVSHVETKANALLVEGKSVPLGALLELGVHLFDLVRFITGDEIRTVKSRMDPLPPAVPELRVSVDLRTSGGIDCCLDIARVDSQRTGKAEWVGENGRLTVDWGTRRLTGRFNDGAVLDRIVEPQPTVLATLRAFVDAIETGSPPKITGLDGCRAVEAVDACYRSAMLGGTIVEVETAF